MAPTTESVAVPRVDDLVWITETTNALLAQTRAVRTALAAGENADAAADEVKRRYALAAAGIEARFARLQDGAPSTTPGDGPGTTARIVRLESSWRDVEAVWNRPVGSLPEQTRKLSDALEAMLALGLRTTMPFLVNEALAGTRVGECLSVRTLVDDAVPAQDVVDVVTRLRDAGGIHGLVVVDAADPRVYKVSDDVRVRLLTWATPLAAAAAGYGAIWLGHRLGLLDALHRQLGQGDAARALTLAYAGAVLHLLVTGLKENRRAATGDDTPDMIGRWLLWLHVKYSAYTMAVLSVIIAAALTMLAVPSGQDPGAQWLLFVTAGYTADSIVDTFLSKVPAFFGTGARGNPTAS